MAAAKPKTYYEILGVPQDATQDQIRTAYLALARKYHPDKTGGDPAAEQKLKEINNAYDTLKKPEKRKEYDRMLRGPSPEEFARAAGAGDIREDFGFDMGAGDPFADLFRGFAGWGQAAREAGARRGPMPGADVEVVLPVTLRDVADGARKTFRVPHRAVCSTCGGTGAAPGTRPETCPECKGTGRVSRTAAANLAVYQTCPRCRGTGDIVPTPCPKCGGRGEVSESRTVAVEVPAGAETGTCLRLVGLGNAGEPGAPFGDLYVTIEVQKDPFFERDGGNVLCELPVPFTTAILGGTVRVPTLRGRANLRIPAGTQSGRTFRMRGQGLPRMNSDRTGDQLVRIRIEVPSKLSDEARKLVERLQQILDSSAYASGPAQGGTSSRQAYG